MKATAKVLAATVLLALTAASTGFGQVGVSGINGINVPPESEVLLSVPFNKTMEASLAVNGTPSGTTLPVATNALDGEDFSGGMYYVRFTSGNANGLWCDVSSNTADDITIDDATVAGMVQDTDTFRVYKHHTIGTLFPALHRGWSYVADTQILLFPYGDTGQFKTADRILTYKTFPVPGWSGTGAATVVPPESLFILRNNSTTQTLHYAHGGTVPDHAVSFLLPAHADKDFLIGTGYPVVVTVSQTGFGGVADRQVLLFNNQASGQFKTADAILTYKTFPVPGWSGTGGSTPIGKSEGFIFRQSSGDAGGVVTVTKPY